MERGARDYLAATDEALLRECDRLPGKFWLRLLYTHPRYFSDELLDLLPQTTHLVPYVDIPLQHISDGVLRAMEIQAAANPRIHLETTGPEIWQDTGGAVDVTLMGYQGNNGPGTPGQMSSEMATPNRGATEK